MRVNPVGVSTEYNTITFKNHGFKTGEIVDYSASGTAIAGLDTNIEFSILKLDDDRSVDDVGVGGTVTTDVTRSKTVDFTSGYWNTSISISTNHCRRKCFLWFYTWWIIYIYTNLIAVRLNLHIFMKKELVMIKYFKSTQETFNIHPQGKNAQVSPIISMVELLMFRF